MTDRRMKAARAKLARAPQDVTSKLEARLGDEAAIAFDVLDTPVGELVAATSRAGLVRLSFHEDPDDVIEGLSRKISPSVVHSRSRLDPVRRELDEYFEGKRKRFGLRLDWSLVRGFNLKVLQATARIPYGGVSTYSDMARTAGSARAARAAGNALHNNPIPIVVPCHRVLHSSGGLGGYGGGLDMKRYLLKLEGALENDS